MSNPKVFIFAPADATGDSHEMLERAGCELALGKANWRTPQGNTEGEIADLATGAQALLGTSIRSSPISRKVMESAGDDLRIVAKCTVGVDDVDVQAATEMGILVTHAPTEANCYGVAEGTVTMILSMLKKVRERDDATKAGTWRDEALQGTFVARRTADGYGGITLGIIGLGRIGKRVCELFAPWRFRIIACDPYVEDEAFKLVGAERTDLETVLKQSDAVSLHVIHTPETENMLGAKAFAMMKPGAIFVNTSRGACVDEPEMAAAIESGEITGAAIDVFEVEPLPADSPLRELGDKVMLSAHMVSSNVGSGIHPGYQWATHSVLMALNGEVPDNVYNKEVIDRWRERFGDKRALPTNAPLEEEFRSPGVPGP